MDQNDRQAIATLFDKLAAVERKSPSRDSKSEAFIRERIARQPGAPFYMAQTIVVQEQALAAAEARMAELEADFERASRGNGGFFGGLFGAHPERPHTTGSVPRAGARTAESIPPQASGGFLAGAAQTALGVTGGVLLGNAIAGMLGGSEAKAAEPANTSANEADDQQGGDEDQLEEAHFEDDGGGDFGDFDL